jgi:hypothetical protein
MARLVKIDGAIHSFPDDATDDDISSALSEPKSVQANQQITEKTPQYPGAGQVALTALSQIAGFSKPSQTPPSVQEVGQLAEGSVYGLGKGTREMYEGMRQGGLGVGETLGLNAPGAQQRYTQETIPVRQEREQFVASQPATFQSGTSAGTFTAKVAPAFLIRQPQAAFGRIAAGAGVGGATGFMDFVDEGSNESRAVNTGVGALIGAGISSGFEAVTGLRNIAPRYIRGKLATQTGQEGEAIETATKVPLTFGQKTGDPMLQQVEQGLAPTTRTIAERNKALNASVKSLTNTVRGVENKPEIVASKVKDALDDAVGAAQAKRKVMASYDYAKFKRATGGEDVISMENAKTELARIADEYKFGSSNMGRQAARLAKTLDEDVNAEQFLNLRSRISDSLAGSGNLFKDIDKAVEKRLAARLMGAIDADITATSKYLSAQGNENAAELLSKATKNYSKNSDVIRDIHDSTLGKLFKTETFVPEKAAESLTKMQPSEIRRAFSILGKRSPEQVDEVTALWLHNAVRKSIGSPTKGAAESTIDPGNIVNTLLSKEHGGAAKLRAIIPDAEKRSQVVKSVRALQRLADRTTPGTGATQSAISKGTEIAGTVAGGAHPVFAARILSKILTPIGIRNALLTDVGRKNLMTLASPTQNQAAYIAAANYFNELEQ